MINVTLSVVVSISSAPPKSTTSFLLAGILKRLFHVKSPHLFVVAKENSMPLLLTLPIFMGIVLKPENSATGTSNNISLVVLVYQSSSKVNILNKPNSNPKFNIAVFSQPKSGFPAVDGYRPFAKVPSFFP